MTAQKHTPVRIWCAPEGEYGQGFDSLRLCTWSDRQEHRDGLETQYVRADVADEMLDALKECLPLFDIVTALDDHGSNALGQAENLIRAAIAKATCQ